jgi:hypothetical protein
MNGSILYYFLQLFFKYWRSETQGHWLLQYYLKGVIFRNAWYMRVTTGLSYTFLLYNMVNALLIMVFHIKLKNDKTILEHKV